jgi:YbbR domain-containing protein
MIDTNPLLEKTFTYVPVTIKNLTALENSNMMLMNSDKDNLTITVRVKGYGEQLNKIDKDDFTAYIDVLGFGEGTSNAKIEISGPTGLEIDSVYPSQIACEVESVISKVMDVTVQYQGSQDEDYYRLDGTSNPSSVKITGPRSVVDSAITAVATINIDGATDTLVKTVPVSIYDGTDTEIFTSVPIDNVRVSVPVYPTKYVDLQPVINGLPLEGYALLDVDVTPSRVKIAAKQEVLDTIQMLNLEELNIEGATSSVKLAKKIINPQDVIVISLDSSPIVNANIEEITEKILSYGLDEIEFSNLGEGYNINTVDQDLNVTVTVRGPAEDINKVEKSDISLVADLKDAKLGSNQVDISLDYDVDIKDISLSVDTINVEIVEIVETEETEETDIDTEIGTE